MSNTNHVGHSQASVEFCMALSDLMNRYLLFLLPPLRFIIVYIEESF